jgi:hypothetical protein
MSSTNTEKLSAKRQAKADAKKRKAEEAAARKVEREAAAAELAEKGEHVDGDAVLEAVKAYLKRFVSYPTEHACHAHVLWIAHTHMMDAWDSTPRLGFMSPEPGSGKTRALEVSELFVPRPVHSVNNSLAYMIRKISDEAGSPTILYDEVDALFSNKQQPDQAQLLAILNAGYRRGATSGRCTGEGRVVKTEDLPAYSAVALAGLKTLPDALATRTIFIDMRRRAPDEAVEPFRGRIHRAEAKHTAEDLRAWCAYAAKKITEQYQAKQYPELPPLIVDRPADCWEPLVSIADAAGGDWPQRARTAAVFMVGNGADRQTLGVELLYDIRRILHDPALHTATLLTHLCNLDESRWLDFDGRGHRLTDRVLADMLKPYGIRSKQVKVQGVNRFGYLRNHFEDAWARYLGGATTDPTGTTGHANPCSDKGNSGSTRAEADHYSATTGIEGSGQVVDRQNSPLPQKSPPEQRLKPAGSAGSAGSGRGSGSLNGRASVLGASAGQDAVSETTGHTKVDEDLPF